MHGNKPLSLPAIAQCHLTSLTEIFLTEKKARRLCRYLGLALLIPAASCFSSDVFDPADIRATITQSASWSLRNPVNNPLFDWKAAPLYDGLVAVSKATGDPRYVAAVIEYGTQVSWEPGHAKYFADDHAVGHAWIDLYLMDRSREERLRPIKERMDSVLDDPITAQLSFTSDPPEGVDIVDRWTWCDALYMGPPTLTRLYLATGDERYLEFLDQEYQYTYDQLYDSDAHLFYRDTRFPDRKTVNGHKVFWSRGIGWVYAGLALFINDLPETWPRRDFYIKLFREMSEAVLAAQQPDGLWRPSLLDPKEVEGGETSGSAFLLYGLTWGVRHGYLDHDATWPQIAQGWKGLRSRILPNHAVGYVQPVGDQPDAFSDTTFQDYGTGAFLLAGSELLMLLDTDYTAPDPSELIRKAESIAESSLAQTRAFARLVTARKDDIAWENDKVAFRVYGPPLKDSVEASGIDVWTKKVAYPVINKWYHLDLSGVQSYHHDNGEGLDAYKVGDSLGCGGMGIWQDEKLIAPDVYTRGEISRTNKDTSLISLNYRYPIRGGRLNNHISDTRKIRLEMGSRLFTITSVFAPPFRYRPWVYENFAPDVAAGLVTQTPEAEIYLDADSGIIAMSDQVGGATLFTGVIAPTNRVIDAKIADHEGVPEGSRHALLIMKTENGKPFGYRAGFAWAADEEITRFEDWIAYLKEAAREPIQLDKFPEPYEETSL